eukprot:m.131660 g.131660  ORF g.131660 m.131660 type:complete len:67 (-) comp11318_c0_seq8:3835-4035(-)
MPENCESFMAAYERCAQNKQVKFQTCYEKHYVRFLLCVADTNDTQHAPPAPFAPPSTPLQTSVRRV